MLSSFFHFAEQKEATVEKFATYLHHQVFSEGLCSAGELSLFLD